MIIRFGWARRESNPHGIFIPQVFETCLSAGSSTCPKECVDYQNYILVHFDSQSDHYEIFPQIEEDISA